MMLCERNSQLRVERQPGLSPNRKSEIQNRKIERAGSRIRTDDLLITNQLLYQLSYAGEGRLKGYNVKTKEPESHRNFATL
jgi:hypothetical protein